MARIPVGHLNPIPTLATFNVASSDRQRFLDFIQNDVRKKLQDPTRAPVVLGRATRLPPEADDPAKADLVDLVLRAGDIGITLRLRADNLAVVGFRNGYATWLEFTHDHTRGPLIKADPKDWKSMPFSATYTSWGIGVLVEKSEDVLGQPAVLDAINGLARYGGADDDVAKRWLRTVIINFVESIRLDAIAHRVDGQMKHPSGNSADRKLTIEDVLLIHNWGNLSEALVIAANQPLAEDFRTFVPMGIHNAQSAAAAMGMVLIERKMATDPVDTSSGGANNGVRQRKRPRPVAIGNMDDEPGIGLRLVHVAGVIVNDIDRENPGELYGEITVADTLGFEDLFNRDKHNYQKVGPGGHADLAGLRRPISGAGDFVIDLHLMDYDIISPNDEVVSGRVAWNSRDTLSSDYNTMKSIQVKGKYGSVTVQFAVLTRAVVAVLEVVMVDGDGEAVPDVYGTITAATTMVSGEALEYKLFDRSRAQEIGVRRNADVPLKTKVIAAALQSVLEVKANLWDRDSFPDLSPDDQIALGSAKFYPRLGGSDSAEITGKYGRVNVKVTWTTSFLPVG